MSSDPVTGEARPTTAEGELLATYLSSRDVACPRCGYNLRGCSGSECPECGRGLALGLDMSGGGGAIPHRMFLLLALGWVLLAGSMNAYRFIGALHDEYVWSSRPYENWGATTLVVPGGGGGTVTFGGVGPTAPPPAVSIFDLSALGWWRAIWATGLAVGALAGLLLLEREWRGPWSMPGAAAGRERRVRRLVAYSWALFGVYAAWHVIVFGRELLR